MPPPTRGEVAGEGGAFEASASTAPLSPASNYECSIIENTFVVFSKPQINFAREY